MSAANANRGPAIVVMGVSAVGKSTIASALADRLGIPYVDADDLHPPTNLSKMASGSPLDDEDRRPWLTLVGEELAVGAASGGVVVACSALKVRYRDQLRSSCPRTVFVHLSGSKELLAARAGDRSGHFMPPALLDSQFAALEPLTDDERGLVVQVNRGPDDIVDYVRDWVSEYD